MLNNRDIISIEELTREEIDRILIKAEHIEKNKGKYEQEMKGKIMVPLFFEPSSRTYLSFQMAMLQMGGKIIDFDVDRSSRKKGESLRDTAKIIKNYDPDVVVIRHNKDGSAQLFSDIMDVPVINAGDGKNHHPTQTLLDLYTIKKITGAVDNTKIALIGDLKYSRTVHSLLKALEKYNNCEIICVSPPELKMPLSLLKTNERIRERGLNELKDTVEEVDIFYMTRIQRERFPQGPEGEEQYKKIASQYKLCLDMLENASPNFRIMHPLPKVNEIDKKIDNTSYAYYFKQAKNGLFVRKALLSLLVK